MKIPFSELRQRLAETPLFAGKTWQIAVEPWTFSSETAAELQAIGDACLAFYRALEKLYIASSAGKNILRNGMLFAPWVAELLERGKPSRLIAHQRARALAGSLPPVLRPDLLLTENGFALTELDSVPGGIGLTAFLNRLYACGDSMLADFWRTLTRGDATRSVVVAVADEAASYRPEFEWLAETLRREYGAKMDVCHPNELRMDASGVFLGNTRVDVVYRFFELFDLENFPAAEQLMEAAEAHRVEVLPPMRAFQEEKMSLALFWHPSLQAFWRESLGEAHDAILRKIIPQTWILEAVESLSATALLWAPRPIRDWRELASLPLRERNWVLKSSGFDENAWGARSVTVGNDASQKEWATALDAALESGAQNKLYVLQDFKKPKRVDFRIFDPSGAPQSFVGRARICPYYFVQGRAEVLHAGTLVTVCPADKKIIHGMSTASLAPGWMPPC